MGNSGCLTGDSKWHGYVRSHNNNPVKPNKTKPQPFLKKQLHTLQECEEVVIPW